MNSLINLRRFYCTPIRIYDFKNIKIDKVANKVNMLNNTWVSSYSNMYNVLKKTKLEKEVRKEIKNK